MFCPKCGNHNLENSRCRSPQKAWCGKCGFSPIYRDGDPNGYATDTPPGDAIKNEAPQQVHSSERMTGCGRRGYAIVGLDNPKSEVNLGAAMRAVGVYGAKALFFSGNRVKPGATDTFRHYRHIPLVRVCDLHGIVPYDCVPVAVDIIPGAIPLPEYRHPIRAFYVFGGEDATLGARVLEWCRDTLYVPTDGCMNLAATVNVVLYDRMQKLSCPNNNNK